MRSTASLHTLSLALLVLIVPLSHAQVPAPDSFDLQANGLANAFAVQPDGNVLVGGSFTILKTQTRNRIARLDADGNLDPNFNPNADGQVFALALQEDGKILIGGQFTTVGNQPRKYIARLLSNGNVDPEFATGLGTEAPPLPSPIVRSILIQPDGKIVVGGDFAVTNLTKRYLVRLNNNGSLDTSFNPSFNSEVYSLALQSDGKVLAGGQFISISGQLSHHIARLNPNGAVDTNFNPNANSAVWSLAVQSDGKVLMGGDFSTVASEPRKCIARLESSGILDTTFDPGTDLKVIAWAPQADGKNLIGGSFTTVSGGSHTNIALLNSNGTPDETFDPQLDSFSGSFVTALGLQSDGKLLIGGTFSRIGAISRYRIARLNAIVPATDLLEAKANTLTWQQNGSSPAFWRTKFQYSTNSTDWLDLGEGVYSPGGWQWTGLSNLPNCTIRARGCVTGGRYNGSSWFVERTLEYTRQTPIQILIHDGEFGVNSHQFGFNVAGETNQILVIECSTNLLDWLPRQTNTLTSGTFYFSDPDWSQSSQRFYRARLWP